MNNISKKKLTVFLTLIIAALAVVISACGSSNSPTTSNDSKTTIAWDVPQLQVSLQPGESQTVQASATITGEHSGLTVNVAPVLAPYISVTPLSIPASTIDQTIMFDLSVNIPADAPSEIINSAVNLRFDNVTSTNPLLVVLNIWNRINLQNIGIKLSVPSEWNVYQSGPTYVSLIGNYVGTELPHNPESAKDICKFTVSSASNISNLSLLEWVKTEGVGVGAPANVTIVPIQVNGYTAYKVVAEEISKQTITWVENGTDIVSLSLICDTNYESQGEDAYTKILNSITLGP